jgi:hypothetical protein
MHPTTIVEQYLALSVKHYDALLCHAQKLQRMIAQSDYDNITTITNHIAELKQMQDEARQNDEFLLADIKNNPQHAWTENPQFLQRQKLLQAVIDLNDQMVPKLKAVMAVAKAELNQLGERRNAFAGYTAKNGMAGRLNSSA